jgi:hypothetical protein
MHVKEIYVIFIHLFDSGILLIIDLNKKKGKKGGNFICEFYSYIYVMFRQFKEKNKNLLRLKLKSEQISVVL